MDESNSATFAATVGPSRAEYVRQVLGTARETLARSRGNNQFRDADEPLGAPEWRSRERPLSSRGRAQPTEHTDAAWWAAIDARIAQALAAEREAIFEEITPVIRSLREMCENLVDQLAELSDQLAELRWRQLGTPFDNPNAAYHALNHWENEERTRIEAATGGPAVAPRLTMRSWSGPKHRGTRKARSRDDEEQEPLEIPSLRALRQNTGA